MFIDGFVYALSTLPTVDQIYVDSIYWTI